MAWFGGKKKPKRKPPVLEPVGTPAVQAAPAAVQAAPAAVQAAPVAQPALEPVPNQGIPAIQAVPASQPVVEVAPVGATADANVMVSTDPVATPSQEPVATGWAKKSVKPLLDIHKKLDHMMDSRGKSLEERYKDRFGDKLPESVATDSARKDYNEKKEAKPEIVFKPRSKLKLKPKVKAKPKTKAKAEEKVENKEEKPSMAGRLTGGLKASGKKTKSVFGNAGAVVGRGAGAVKSGIGKGTGAVTSGIGKGAGAVKSGIGMGASKVMGLFGRGSKAEEMDYNSMKVAELKAELKKKGLSTSGKKADLIKRLTK